jgi:hypothetical protein
MSTIRPTDWDLVPVGWVQTSWDDPIQYTHRQTGLCLEAANDGPSQQPGVSDCGCLALRCRTAAGETETVVSVDRVTSVQRAKQVLSDWMQTYNRLKDRYDWDDTIAAETVANNLAGERSHVAGTEADERHGRW